MSLVPLRSPDSPVPPPTPVRFVLFDLDGTLVDAFADIAAAANHIREIRGLAPLSVEEVKTYVGHGARHLVAGVTGLPDPSPQLDEAFEQLLAFYQSQPASQAQPFDGVVLTLHILRARGLPLGIVTNKPHAVTTALLDALELTPLFDIVLGEKKGRPAKPDPSMVLEACQHIGFPPVEGLFVGDSAVDVEVARRVSMKMVGVTHGTGDRAELEALSPYAVIDHFSELPDLIKNLIAPSVPTQNRSSAI